MAAAEALFACKAGSSQADPARLGPGPGLDSGQSQSHGTTQPAAGSCPPAADGPSPVHKRDRRSYNAAQTAALLLEAQEAARGETRASNHDLSELGGGRVVTGQDAGSWFRNQQGKKRQRAGAGADEADQAPSIVNESC